jgi:hypothetical protein
MNLKSWSAAILAILAVFALSGCSIGDAPTQGIAPQKGQIASDLDKKLDELEKMPVPLRGAARRVLDRAIGAKGTPAQQKRYVDLMKDVPQTLTPAMPAGQVH